MSKLAFSLIIFSLLSLTLCAQDYSEKRKEIVREIIEEKIHFPQGVPIQTDLRERTNRSTSVPNEVLVSGSNAPESEVHAAIYTGDTNRLVSSAMRQQGGLAMPIWYSSNFGNTWQMSSFSPNPPNPNALLFGGGDPNFVYDDNGRLYYSWINLFQKSAVSDSIFWALYWAYSDDYGATWQQSQGRAIAIDKKDGGIQNIGALTVFDKQWMAADLSPTSPYYNSVYCTFLQANSQTGALFIGLRKKGVNDTEFTQVSVNVSTTNWAFIQFGNVAVTSDGTVHVTFFASENGQTYGFYHCKSVDGGLTFDYPDEITQANVPSFTAWDPNPNLTGVSLQRFYPSCYLASDQTGGAYDGNLYLTFTANGIDTTETYGLDVWLTKSSDGGDSWTTPIRVNNDQQDRPHQFYSSIYVDQTGDVLLGWYDRRDDTTNISTDYYVGISTDGGGLFSNLKANLSPTLFSTVGNANNGFGIGEYTQVLGSNGSIIPFWSDGRNNNGNLDIYSARVAKSDGLGIAEGGPITDLIDIKGLYPNPASDFITLEYGLKSRSGIKMVLYSASGQELRSAEYHRAEGPHKETWPLGLAAGSYFFEIQTDFGRFIKPFVVR